MDFSKADLLGRHWWLKLGWVLDELERENYVRVLAMQHAQQTACLNQMAGEKAFDYHWKEANGRLTDVHNALFSWSRQTKPTKAKAAEDYMTMWERVFGKLDDTTTKAKVDRLTTRLRTAASATTAPTTPRQGRRRHGRTV